MTRRSPKFVDADEPMARFASEGIDTVALAAKLQADGAKAFVDAWYGLISRIEAQHALLS